MGLRFHVLGIPHTASNRAYCACAFTMKVVNLCAMLHMRGHHVIHLGNEASNVICDENVVITRAEDIGPPAAFLNYDLNSATYQRFNDAAIRAIARRKQPKDFLLCPWGAGHRVIADAHPDLVVVESGIGYPGGVFAPFRVFESYACLHAYYGTEAIRVANKFRWYDVVIPNAFDPQDFLFSTQKDDFCLFLGYRHNGEGKGFHVARDAARDAGIELIVAGPDSEPGKREGHVRHVGLLGILARAQLLAHARALIAPSVFLEPFCGAQVEAFLSGTPVISTDWGAFAEYNLHSITGWRCRTHEEFVWAIKHADQIDPHACRKWAIENFCLERVSHQYDQFFDAVSKVYTGNGWYERNDTRTDLDGPRRYLPAA